MARSGGEEGQQVASWAVEALGRSGRRRREKGWMVESRRG